ncbi:MAG: GntR family transcriptional regulator [Hyphomicrobium sp.]
MNIPQNRTAFGFSGPLYAQVAAYLRSKISASELTSAAPLPNEAALAKDIGVSIGTVRKALEILEDEKLIHRRQGRGTFVVDDADQGDFGRFSILMREEKRLCAEVMAFKGGIEPSPTAEAAAALNLNPGERVIAFDIDWRAGPHVRAYERIIVREATFPGLDRVAPPPTPTPTLFQIYRRDYHVVVHRISERITAFAADEVASTRLAVARQEPLIEVVRLARTRTGQPVEWSRRLMLLGGGAHYNVAPG